MSKPRSTPTQDKRAENLDAKLSELQVAASRTAAALALIASPLEGDADEVTRGCDSLTLRSISDAMYGHVHILQSLSRDLDLAVERSAAKEA